MHFIYIVQIICITFIYFFQYIYFQPKGLYDQKCISVVYLHTTRQNFVSDGKYDGRRQADGSNTETEVGACPSFGIPLQLGRRQHGTQRLSGMRRLPRVWPDARIFSTRRPAAAKQQNAKPDGASERPLRFKSAPPREKGVCRHCGGSVEPPRRTFCSSNCVDEHRLRTDGNFVRQARFINVVLIFNILKTRFNKKTKKQKSIS